MSGSINDSSSISTTGDPSPPAPSPPTGGTCPVDHSSRAAWLETARKSTTTCDSATLHPSPPTHLSSLPPTLSPHRQVSSIPRAANVQAANSETVHPHISASGHWVYPSEQMFFSAMQRKNWSPTASDMSTIVPIHNAVNERAWTEIKSWERARGADSCGGPRLASFAGDSSRLSPKARLMVLLGYQRPFDRHDWTIDRCGKKIEYIIDFYSGKQDPNRPDAVSFYLDVRPKLNSVEGAIMRLQRFWGTWFGGP